MPTVYGVPLSPFVRKVRLAMEEKGIEYQLESVLPFPPHNAAPEFRAMSPLGKVPALRDGDFTISDSSVILNYLDQKHPSSSLRPADAEGCARALWFEEFADSKLAETIGPIFFNRVVKPNILQQEPDPSAIEAALEALPPFFDYLEGQLSDNGFLVGEELTVADVAVGAMLRLFQVAGESVDASKWPKLAAYHGRLDQRPTFEKVFAAENALIASMAG